MGDLLDPLATLRLGLARFTLVPTEPLQLPPVKGTFWRGVLGLALKQMTCLRPGPRDCPPCQLGNDCPYGYLYETRSSANEGDSVTDVPAPFIIQPLLDYRMLYRPGEPVEFDLVLIGRGLRYLPYFIAALEHLEPRGLGQRRARFVLDRVTLRHPYRGAEQPVYRRGDAVADGYEPGILLRELLADAPTWVGDRITVCFLTPTRIKDHGRYTVTPEFRQLVGALLRRVAALAEAHGDLAWTPDSMAVEVAAAVTVEHAVTHWVGRSRYSARQEQGMSLSGCVGEVSYRGALEPFRSLLLLGALVQVGKTVSFGNGRYTLLTAPDQ